MNKVILKQYLSKGYDLVMYTTCVWVDGQYLCPHISTIHNLPALTIGTIAQWVLDQLPKQTGGKNSIGYCQSVKAKLWHKNGTTMATIGFIDSNSEVDIIVEALVPERILQLEL